MWDSTGLVITFCSWFFQVCITVYLYIIVDDIDECSLEIDDCDQDCINTAGGYDCICFDGYFLDTSNDTCEGMFSLIRNVKGVIVTLLDSEISWFLLQKKTSFHK